MSHLSALWLFERQSVESALMGFFCISESQVYYVLPLQYLLEIQHGVVCWS